MRSHLIKGLLLLSCVFALAESKLLTKKDKTYLLERISEWDDAPEAVKISEGTVVTRRGNKTYTFAYKTEDGSTCDAVMDVKKDGSGEYSWECSMSVKEEEYDEDYESRRRQIRKNKKPSKKKGTGKM